MGNQIDQSDLVLGKSGNRMKSGENRMKNGHLQPKIDTGEEFCEFF
jgi:hypothetical protein